MKSIKHVSIILSVLALAFVLTGTFVISYQPDKHSLRLKSSHLLITSEDAKLLNENDGENHYITDLGTFPANRIKLVTLKIRNNSSILLNIIDVKTFCGCSSAKLSKNTIAPNEVIEVALTIIPNSLNGIFSKEMYIRTDSKQTPVLKIQYRGNAKTLFDIAEGETFYANIIKRNTPIDRKFTIKFSKPLKDIKIREVENENIELLDVLDGDLRRYLSGNLKQFSIVSVANITTNSFEILLSVNAAEAEKGKAKVFLKLPITEPKDNPPLRVSIIGRIY